MPRVWRYPVPRGARPAPPTTPSNPAPRPQQQQHRSPRSPELQRSPATEFNENEIADGGLVAAPAGGGSRCRRRSCRRGPRARESMDKEEERGPKLPQFQCRVFGDTRYLAARGRRRRPHHRIRRRGRSSSSIGRPDRPSSSVPPQPNLTKTKSPTAALWRPQQVAGRAVDGAHAGAALVRASQWIKRRNAGAGPKLPQFQCRVFGDTRYLAARGRRRRPHHRIRRRGRSSSSIGRPDRPSSSVPPQPNLTKTKSPTAALWRPQQVAGRAVDGAHAGAALVRASQWIKRRNAGPKLPQFQCRVFGDTRYLAARGRRRRPHHRIRRRGRSSSSIGRPDRPSSSVPPQPNLTKTKSPTAALWRPQQVAGRAVDGAHAGAALVRASQWIKRRNAGAGPKLPQFQCRVFGDTRYLAARGRRRRPHHRIRRRGRSSSSIGRPDRP